MNSIRFFALFILFLGTASAADLEFTKIEKYTPEGDGLVTLNLDGRHTVTVPGEFEYWTDSGANQYFESKLVVFQSFYPGENEKAHTLHVQFLTLTEAGGELFKTPKAYLDLIRSTTESRRDSFKARNLRSEKVAGRKFVGFQYVATINDDVEEGLVYATLVDNLIVVLRAQELNEFRSDLSKLWAYAATLDHGVEGTDNDPLLGS